MKIRNLEKNFEQKILIETMCKFYKVMLIRPKAVFANLWAAVHYSKFWQFHIASQQVLIIQLVSGYSVLGR